MGSWKRSATLILAGICQRVTPTKRYNYRLLMLKRNTKSRNFANCMVFPGGLIDKADLDREWLPLCAQFKPVTQFKQDFQGRMRMPLYSDIEKEITPDNAMFGELAVRICALRETFEETGMLLAVDPAAEGDKRLVITASTHPSLLPEFWQSRIKSNPDEFLDMFRSLGLLPDIFSLQEWANWLTPTHLPNRFDTAFYFVNLPSTFPITQDSEESQMAIWKSPEQILRSFLDSELEIFPPQIYELGRMCHFKRLDQLSAYAQQRSRLGSERWLPKATVFGDGAVVVYPGDQRYPEKEDLNQPPTKLPTTSRLSWDSDTRRNRNSSVKTGSNLLFGIPDVTEERIGHVRPVRLDEIH